MGQKLDLMETFLGTRNLEGGVVVMTHLGQASGHGQSVAVITDTLWELGVTPLERCYY